jgi:4-amino-4-deoxy-L-arabinose transferase-like glycosyltransferase
LIIAACLVSNAIWVLNDRHVWPWDQANYADWSVRLWQARLSGIGAWAHAVVGVLGGQQPLITWLGQFFIPLRHLTGDFESAMLFLNVFAAGGTLIIIYDISRRLAASGLSSLAGIMVCAGSGLFIGLTHQYLVEMLQCFTAASTVAVAWGVEKRSPVRTLALVLATVALSFLSKSSSMIFVLPMLAYIAIALWATRRKPRPAFRRSDAILLVGAALIALLAATWYAIHWQAMVHHFVEATTDDFALYWGSPVDLRVKLGFWVGWLIKSLSPFSILSAGMLAIVAAALAISTVRLLKRPLTEWLEASIADGILFALALAGTIIATIFAFSLQINEDVRYIISMMPFISVLVGWSLFVIGNRLVEQLLLGTLAINVIIDHTYAHGLNLFHIAPAAYLLPVDKNTIDRTMLVEAIRSTCHREDVNRPNFVVVSYANLNANSVNFYSGKESHTTGNRCFYFAYNSFDPNVQHALDTINAVGPAYIVTVAPEKQPLPDFANVVSRRVTEHLSVDPRYRLESGIGSYIQVYHRIDLSNR